MADITLQGTVSISSLFDNLFIIPGYQRMYDWGYKEVDDLLKDLDRHAEESRGYPESEKPEYLLNSILTVYRGGGLPLEIIDGQQRLTTIMLLFSVARDYGNGFLKPSWTNTLQSSVAKADGESNIPRVSFVSSSKAVVGFMEALAESKVRYRSSIDPAAADASLQRTYNQIWSWFVGKFPKDGDEESKETSLSEFVEFLAIIRNHVKVANVCVSSDTVAWQAFERANDRGRPLSIADKVKSDIFGLAKGDTGKQQIVSDNWRSTLDALRSERLAPDVFLHHLILADISNTKIGKDDIRREMRKVFKIYSDDPVEISAYIKKAAEDYQAIYKGNFPNETGKECIPLQDMNRVVRFKRFTQIRHILLVSRNLPSEHFAEIAQEAERLAVVLTLSKERGQQYQNELFELTKFIRERLSSTNPETLVDLVNEFVTELLQDSHKGYGRSAKFAAALEEGTIENLGGKQVVHYLLARAEGYLNGMVEKTKRKTSSEVIGTAHIEHILPHSLPVAAVEELGVNKEEAEILRQAIGNLTIWEGPSNSSYGNTPYSKCENTKSKKLGYAGSRYYITKTLVGGLDDSGGKYAVIVGLLPRKNKWSVKNLRMRQVELGSILCSIFLQTGTKLTECTVGKNYTEISLEGRLPVFPSNCDMLEIVFDGVGQGLRTANDLISIAEGSETIIVINKAISVLEALSFIELDDAGNTQYVLTEIGQILFSESRENRKLDIALSILKESDWMYLAEKDIPEGHPDTFRIKMLRGALEWAEQTVHQPLNAKTAAPAVEKSEQSGKMRAWAAAAQQIMPVDGVPLQIREIVRLIQENNLDVGLQGKTPENTLGRDLALEANKLNPWVKRTEPGYWVRLF